MNANEQTFYRDAIKRGHYHLLHLGIICAKLGRIHHFEQVADTIPHMVFRDFAERVRNVPLDPNVKVLWYKGMNELIEDVNTEREYQMDQLRKRKGY